MHLPVFSSSAFSFYLFTLALGMVALLYCGGARPPPVRRHFLWFLWPTWIIGAFAQAPRHSTSSSVKSPSSVEPPLVMPKCSSIVRRISFDPQIMQGVVPHSWMKYLRSVVAVPTSVCPGTCGCVSMASSMAWCMIKSNTIDPFETRETYKRFGLIRLVALGFAQHPAVRLRTKHAHSLPTCSWPVHGPFGTACPIIVAPTDLLQVKRRACWLRV